MREPTKRLQELFAGRKDFLFLILSGMILALGIEIIASEIIDAVTPDYYIRIILGVTCIIVSILGFIPLAFSEFKIDSHLDGTVLFDSKCNDMIRLKEYKFSSALSDAITAACIESGAIRKTWDENPIAPTPENQDVKKQPGDKEHLKSKKETEYILIIKTDSESFEKTPTKSSALLREAAEYVILEELSLHLSSHFAGRTDDKRICEYTRNETPQILLKNRILSLLCSPLEEREGFLKLANSEIANKGEIVSAFGSDGSRFSRFQLHLPVGSSVTRPVPDTLCIDSPRIRIELQIDFSGFSSNIDPDYVRMVLGRSPQSTRAFQVKTHISVTVKKFTFFRQSGWDYYRWLDSFMDRIEEFLLFEKYLNSVNWDEIKLQTHLTERVLRGVLGQHTHDSELQGAVPDQSESDA